MTGTFSGFHPTLTTTIALYEAFFTEVLPFIEDTDELKVTLHAFRALHQREGLMRYLLLSDFSTAALFPDAEDGQGRVERGLLRALARQTFLMEVIEVAGRKQALYFLNDHDGRTAAAQVRTLQWKLIYGERPVEILPPRPNIYRLYEQNIGALTPMISEELTAAQNEFPELWLEEAMRIATASNKRSWRYIRAILDRWQKEGKQYETSARPAAQERRVARDPSDFIIE